MKKSSLEKEARNAWFAQKRVHKARKRVSESEIELKCFLCTSGASPSDARNGFFVGVVVLQASLRPLFFTSNLASAPSTQTFEALKMFGLPSAQLLCLLGELN